MKFTTEYNFEECKEMLRIAERFDLPMSVQLCELDLPDASKETNLFHFRIHSRLISGTAPAMLRQISKGTEVIINPLHFLFSRVFLLIIGIGLCLVGIGFIIAPKDEMIIWVSLILTGAGLFSTNIYLQTLESLDFVRYALNPRITDLTPHIWHSPHLNRALPKNIRQVADQLKDIVTLHVLGKRAEIIMWPPKSDGCYFRICIPVSYRMYNMEPKLEGYLRELQDGSTQVIARRSYSLTTRIGFEVYVGFLLYAIIANLLNAGVDNLSEILRHITGGLGIFFVFTIVYFGIGFYAHFRLRRRMNEIIESVSSQIGEDKPYTA